jgi:hypothetical protein
MYYSLKYPESRISVARQINSGHPIDPDELKELNKYMFNPLGEQEVLDKIEDINLHHSKYHQLFQKYPLHKLGRGEQRKVRSIISIEKIRQPTQRILNDLGFIYVDSVIDQCFLSF